MTSTPTIDTFLSQSATWSKMDGRNFLVQLKHEDGSHKDFGLPIADVKSIHPDLAAILLTRLEVKTKAKRMLTLNGEQIRDTARLLQRGAVQFLGSNGTIRYLTGLHSISPGSCSHDLVWFDAEVVSVIYGGFVPSKMRIEEALADISGTQPFVLRTDTSRFAVEQKHLDTTFPGWRERWRMTRTAAMEPSVWLSAIFVRPQTQTQHNEMEDYGLESAAVIEVPF